MIEVGVGNGRLPGPAITRGGDHHNAIDVGDTEVCKQQRIDDGYTAVVTATPAARETTANTVKIGAASSRRIACLNNTGAAYHLIWPYACRSSFPRTTKRSCCRGCSTRRHRARVSRRPRSVEVIVADNGSTDDTAAIAPRAVAASRP